MDDQMRLEQSRFGVKTCFAFEDDRLIHTIRDQNGERTFSADYEAIAVRNTSSLRINNRGLAGRFTIISFALMFVGVGMEFINDVLGGSIVFLSVAIIIGLVACNLLNVFAVRFILVPLIPLPPEAQGHPLRVIDDSKSAFIMYELEKRRRLRLKALYGKADLTRDPAEEIARLVWLRDDAVLSDAELELETARIKHGSAEGSSDTDRNRLN